MAGLLRDVTAGMTVRELAQRFGGGKTAWSEYRSDAQVIPVGRLGIVVEDRVRDPLRRRELLARARRLHGRALTPQAEAEAAPTAPPGPEAARLYAGGAGLFATNPEAGGPGADFAVGPDYVARSSPDGKEIWQANAKGANWRPIGGPARNLYAGGAGLFAVDAATGQILKYDGAPGSWSPIGTAGVSLAVGSDSVYRVDSRLEVSRWTGGGTQWTPLGFSARSVAPSG